MLTWSTASRAFMVKPFLLDRYEEAFTKTVGAPFAYGFYKGRVALHAILKALEAGPGDTVIFPGFTCIMVPHAAAYLGARPVYVDIQPDTYNMDPEKLAVMLSRMKATEARRVKAVVVQHTFGIPADLDAISAVTEKYGIPIIEDCAHSLGSKYKGRLTGLIGTASFFSSQWSKPYSTGLGGIAATKDPVLASKLRIIQSSFARPGAVESGLLAFQVFLHRRLFSPRLYWTSMKALNALAAAGLFIGSSSREEHDGGMPEGYGKTMGECQAEAGLQALAGLKKGVLHRKELGRLYSCELSSKGAALMIPEGCDPVLLRYPVRVKDKDAVLLEARRRMAEVGSWFETVLHPDRDTAKAGYVKGSCPVGEEAARHIVNLPTHPKTTTREAKRSLGVVMKAV